MAPRITNISGKTRCRFYRILLFILLLCGYNYNFFDKNIFIKIAAKFYCIALIIVIIYTTFACRNVHFWPETWHLLEYVTSAVLILCFQTQMKLFFEKINTIDMFLRISRRHYGIELCKIIVFTIVLWIVRLVYVCLHCMTYSCYNILSLFIISQLSLVSLDVNGVWRCVIFDVVRYRLKILRRRLEESPENNYYLYVNNSKTLKENKMKLLMSIYRSIADALAVVSPELSATMFLSVLFNVPTLIAQVYHVLLIIESHQSYVTCLFIMIHTIQIIYFLFTPFLIVEFYSIEVEKIRLFLIHKLIDETDAKTKEDVDLFIRYTEMRPFSYRIWRIIPLNATLPLELVNLCINFVLVLRNFTHLYG